MSLKTLTNPNIDRQLQYAPMGVEMMIPLLIQMGVNSVAGKKMPAVGTPCYTQRIAVIECWGFASEQVDSKTFVLNETFIDDILRVSIELSVSINK